MMRDIAIIPAPGANDDQLENLAHAVSELSKSGQPIYVTKASLNSFTKDDVFDWLQTLMKVCHDMGWDPKERV